MQLYRLEDVDLPKEQQVPIAHWRSHNWHLSRLGTLAVNPVRCSSPLLSFPLHRSDLSRRLQLYSADILLFLGSALGIWCTSFVPLALLYRLN
jgi:hypothetical protein